MTTNDEACGLIEAFIDGEAVEAAELSRALSDESAREHLIDVLVLRGFVGGYGGSRSIGSVAPPRREWRTAWLSVAAAAFAVAALGGYEMGRRAVVAPPAAARAVETPTDPSSVAPRPTRVIQLHDGVDWHERAGG